MILLLLSRASALSYLASVLSFFAAGAQETVVQLEVVAKTGLLQLCFALAIRNYRNVHFLMIGEKEKKNIG